MSDASSPPSHGAAAVLGVFLVAAAAILGYQLGSSAIRFKELDRSVTVKGLSEREVPADIVIWPIAFTATENDLSKLYETLAHSTETIRAFLTENGIPEEAISVSPPAVTDKLAQQYGGGPRAEFRYVANQSVTVYSKDVDRVRTTIDQLAELGRAGIALAGDPYRNATEYLFTGLNDVKPEMIEEATRKAREVAQKFAADSQSKLGKIRSARQGQFSINDRDKNNPHIKKLRIVSTVEYYLSD